MTRPPAHLGDPLTERELTILKLLANGMHQPAIATAIYVSVDTVKTDCVRMRTKLGAFGTARLIAVGYELGLLSGSVRVASELKGSLAESPARG